jgi:hypothetical protein
MRRRIDILFWFLVLAIVSGLSALTVALGTKNTSALETFGWIMGAVLPALMWLYGQAQKRSIRVFLFTNYLRSLFSTRALTWNLSATLQSEDITPTTLESIVQKLIELEGDRTTVTWKRISDYNTIVDITPGPSLDINYSPTSPPYDDVRESNLPYLQISIKNYRVGYRQASHAIRREIIPILEKITSVLRTAESKYSLVVDFDKDNNPFFGLFVAKIPPEAVSNFFIRLNLRDFGQSNTVLISESKISINTGSQHALENLALDVLAFNASSAEQLKGA